MVRLFSSATSASPARCLQGYVDKEISVLKRLNKIPKLLADTSVRLAALEFIKHIRISDTGITASSETKGTRIKLPITSTHHQQRFGLDVQYSALVLNFNNIFSNGHLYRAGHSMKSLPSQILERWLQWWTKTLTSQKNK